MFYEFPVGLSLDEVRRVVAEHNVRLGANFFIEKDCGDYVIFNYLVSTNASWPEPGGDHGIPARDCAILRECRGLIFAKNGVPLSRRWAKFFNVNEKPWTQAKLIDWSQPHVILEKLDGSMITPLLIDGKVRWTTKMGLSEQASQAEAFADQNPHYERFAREVINCGFTPLFEWCSRQQTIVVDYPEDAMILTGLRDNDTGLLLDRARMLSWAEPHGIPVVKMYEGSAAGIEALLAETNDLVGAEGWIIRFDNGHQLKVKGKWYCSIHGTKDLLQLEKDVWALVLEDRMDDAMALMDAADRDRCERFTEAFNTAIANTANRLDTLVIMARAECDDDKKRFATEWLKNYPDKRDVPLFFQIWDGRDPVEVVKVHLKKNCGSITKVNAVRDLVGDLTWEDYRDRKVVLDD